jgi:uncharacterized membrane protein
MKPVAARSLGQVGCIGLLSLSVLTGWGATTDKLDKDLSVVTAVLRPCEKNAQDDCVKVDVTMSIDAPIDIVWQVITDYQHAAQFISNLRSSSETQLGPQHLQVEQVGRVGWNALTIDIKTVYHVTLNRQEKTIQSEAVAGDLKRVTMFTQLQARPNGGTLLEYTLKTDPARWAPLGIAEELLKRNAVQSFADLKREILKRSTATSSSKPAA